jgi:hypothetical protein
VERQLGYDFNEIEYRFDIIKISADDYFYVVKINKMLAKIEFARLKAPCLEIHVNVLKMYLVVKYSKRK